MDRDGGWYSKRPLFEHTKTGTQKAPIPLIMIKRAGNKGLFCLYLV